MEKFCISIEVNSPKESSNVGGGQNGIRKVNGTLDFLAMPCLFDFRLIQLFASSQDVTCRSKSIIGKLVDKSIVLDNCR